jgi:hypothetical protein
MAQRTQVILTCDVHDGDADAVDSVAFTVEGQSYECELCEAHLAEFRDAMEIWSSHSRVVGRGRAGQAGSGSGRGRRRASSGDGPSTAEVREWARAQGLPVSTRGRVPAELHAAFEAAH